MRGAGAQVILNMESRIKVKKAASQGGKNKELRVDVEYHKEKIAKKDQKIVKAYTSNIVKTIKDLLPLNPMFKDELQIFLTHSEFAQPWKLCDFSVALTTASREDLQDVLATFDLVKRLKKALILLKKELDISKLQHSINQKLETTISKQQREYFLREQLKTIQKELGLQKDDKQCDIDKFNARADKLSLSEEAKTVFDEELEKLGMLDIQSAEYSVVRSYIDWLTILPWGRLDEETKDLAFAMKVLQADHYGLEDVKERIFEFLSVGKLKGGTKGSIICLVGPPGTGKTSVGKSIAHCLSRKFFRFSVGGMHDEAEIKGHRRTYVGAMPGKIVQALKSTKCSNPIIMIDEIDKIGSGHQGDPASALLEVLDPEQNKEFLDHYLDVRFDLSEILFIVTCNTLDTIPAALKDRMEVLRLAGYVKEEKIQIAKKYLIPKTRKEFGLKTTDFSFTNEALRDIVELYCREAGVRGFEKKIQKILRKVVARIVMRKEKIDPNRILRLSERGKKKITLARGKVKITDKTIGQYLGEPIFRSELFYGKNSPEGVATGLAWTELGGAVLYIEAVKNEGKDKGLQLTGNAGDVMKESATISWTYLLSEVKSFLPKGVSLEKTQMHIHIPEGATPKDGPSAGITITTAMLSLLLKKPVLKGLAMTGEITLRGRVLPIGGLKEKVIAAKREGMTKIIVPEANRRDFEELAPHLKKGLKMYYVTDYNQVFKIAFAKR